MNRKRENWLVVLVVFLVFGQTTMADEAEDAFNSLYGEEMKRVVATPSLADDIILANKLLEAAHSVSNQPSLFAVLCEKTYGLAGKSPTGCATALAAMELLAEKIPEKKIECFQKSADLLQSEYGKSRGETKTKIGQILIQALKNIASAQVAAGNLDGALATLKQALSIASSVSPSSGQVLQAQLVAIAKRQAAEKQVAALKAKLTDNPGDTALRKGWVQGIRVCNG